MALDTFNPYLFVSSGEQSNKFLTPTYSGGIASFQAQRAQQLTKLLVQIDLVQSGSGDPAPDNIRPISGRTGLTVTAAGKNLCGEAFTHGIYTTSNGIYYSHEGAESRYVSIGIIPVKGGQTYTFSWIDDSSNIVTIYNVVFYKGNEFVSGMSLNGVKQISVPENADGVALNLQSTTTITSISQLSISNPQLELGSTATTYEPYQGETYEVDWTSEAGTIYGGTLDVVSGVLTVDWDYIASYNGETLPGEWISDRDVYAEGTTPTTGAEVAYKLAEPVTYQLAPEKVMTVPGFNHIYSDAGPVIDIKF